MLETLARDQERPALAQEYAPTWQGPEGQRAPTAYFSAHPKGLGIPARPGPSYLEMPAKAQMFSVRLPSLSTRLAGPPGPCGHASHAPGTMETVQKSEGEADSS